MPTIRNRRRKPRKRKRKEYSSSRQRSGRSVSNSHANAPTSDEDFVLDSEDEDSSSDSDESSGSSTDKETEDEEGSNREDGMVVVHSRDEANQTCSSRSRRKRPRRLLKPNSSDEEFNVDLETDLTDDELARQGHRSTRTSEHLSNVAAAADFVMDVKTNPFSERVSRPARANKSKRRKQDSSDEDFEVSVDTVLGRDAGADEGAVAARPITRAMDVGQVSDFGQLAGRSADANSKSNYRPGEASFCISSSSAREANSTDKDTAANKRKGKQKVFEGEEHTSRQFAAELVVAPGNQEGAAAATCGICLNETTVVDRGKLDCCDHYFCFGCIMEWAKVESRCPMCKQRFTTVAKSGSGVSKRTRMVRIPLRDQVYIPPEDELSFEDPYADVVCMECHGTGDERLLLLCDRCDSAAHTFCVGLGRSVPRGDWYCRDCQSLIGESSGSASETDEVVLASDDEEDVDEFLLRSIVASESLPVRQRRVQRVPASTSGVPTRSRRRSGASQRRGLWRHLLSRERRGSRRRVVTAPRLSQSARTFLSAETPEPNPAPHLLEPSQSGAARTVPQQRRLQERIIALRNNWGRIQTGDVDFDAVRTQRAGSGPSTAAPIGTATPVSSLISVAGSGIDNRLDGAEPSSQSNKDVERAWRIMDRARNLSAGTSGGVAEARNPPAQISGSVLHHQKSILIHRGSEQSSHSRTSQSAARAILNTSAFPSMSEVSDRPTTVLPTRVESTRGLKHHEEDGVKVSLSLAAKNGEDKKREPLANPLTMNSGQTFEEITANRTQSLPGDASMNEGAFCVKDINVAKPSYESVKVHLIELVKKQTWPVYIAERLDKEQFKKIARAAVHALLELCDPRNKSCSIACSHVEDQGKSPVRTCCTNCLDQYVEEAVRTAKEKIVPHSLPVL